jgi:hypothetical protein
MIILLLQLLLVNACRETEQQLTVLPDQDITWQQRGDSIISRTFDTLRNTLQRAIAEKGYAGAVGTCNSQALPLTRSYASQGIRVKRTSAWLRNPANAPDSLEAVILEKYGQWVSNSKPLKPMLQKDPSGTRHYFKPIMLQAMCMPCHGNTRTDISEDTRAALRQWYPADQAVNFKEGSWRGIWHLTFEKE